MAAGHQEPVPSPIASKATNAAQTETRKCYLLALPRELRDRIYDYLIYWKPVTIPSSYSVCVTVDDRSRAYRAVSVSERHTKDDHSYADSRIQLPINPSLVPSKLCSQIRSEYYEHLAGILRRETPVTVHVNVMVPFRGSLGSYLPAHNSLSPSFMRILPLLKEIKQLRVEAWPGWTWWNGTNPMELKETLDMLLSALQKVEVVEVEALIHAWHFWNWDLPPDRYQLVMPFLQAPILGTCGNSVRYIKRELKVPGDIEGALRDIYFYKKTEELQDDTGLIHVVEEKALLDDDSILNELEFEITEYDEKAACVLEEREESTHKTRLEKEIERRDEPLMGLV